MTKNSILSSEENAYYGKQLVLPEFGPIEQIRLKNSKVLVVGAGGLGCPALLYLAGAGVGDITIVDGDVVQLNNLHRQILYSYEDIGVKKVVAASKRLSGMNPFINITAVAHHLTIQNADELIKNADLVIDATDNFDTRYLLGEYTAQKNIPMVFAAIFGFEGQLTVFNYQNGSSFQQMFPVKPAQALVRDCSTNGVLGFVSGILGILQAAEAVKILTGIGTVMSGKLMLIDLLTLDKKEFIIEQPLPDFLSTSNKPIENSERMIDEITVSALKHRVEYLKEDIFLLDVREPFEYGHYNIGGKLIPLGQLPARMNEISAGKDIVVMCRSGIRSMKACKYIAGIFVDTRVFNLKGGLLAWEAENEHV